MTDTSWQDQGVCRTEDPDLFFPGQGGDTEPAKAICRTCPVQATCAQWALDNGEKFGIWGGLSGQERREIRKRRSLTIVRPEPQHGEVRQVAS